MRRFLLFLSFFATLLCFAEETYTNDTCRFTFVLPDSCHVIPYKASNNYSSFLVFNSDALTSVAYIMHYDVYQKGKAISYRKMKKSLLETDSTAIIINERPFYDLLRHEITCLSTLGENNDTVYEQFVFKASSYDVIRCPYPLSNDSKRVLETFDNKLTFKGKLSHLRQNAGTLLMTIYLTLLCFVGYNARGKEKRWLYIVASVLLLVLPIICLWQDMYVLAFVEGVSLLLWGLFFSHNKYLIWIIKAIFG